MKLFITLLVGFGITFGGATFASTTTDSTVATASPNGSFNVLLKAFSDWQNLKQTQSEKEIALAFEENLTFPSLKEIERIEVELALVNQKLELLNQQYLGVEDDVGQETFLESIDLRQEEVADLMIEKEGYETTYKTRKEKQQATILQLKQELEDLAEDIEKQKSLIQKQLYQTFGQALFVTLLLLFLLFLKALSGRLVIKFSDALNERRQQALLRINKVVFNLLIVLILIGTVSSQLVSLLPFLALLGTGIAFAVRDALSSFLGWFLIGGENGYRAGQIIRLGDFYGRVHEVTPFLTLVKEIRGDHETGEMVSFPNKVIFEQPVSHFSKYGGFVHKELNFLISEETDIDAAKSGLNECIKTVLNAERKDLAADITRLVKHFSLAPEDVNPLVWVENNDHGLGLRARFLVKLNQAAFTKATIEEAFIRLAQTSDKINFHYTDSGRNQQFKLGEGVSDRDASHFH